jgi:serine phosphatase RsbU (regulator of sigma subunit)
MASTIFADAERPVTAQVAAQATIDTVPDIVVAPEHLVRTKVLIVDDQPANLLALEATLAELDLDLVKASSGPDALRRVLKDDFALILMDVKMPGMNGFETAELIRQRKRSRHTPIIFLTAFETSDEQVFNGYAHGAVDYLLKPIIPHVLKSKVTVFADIYRKAEEIKRQAEMLYRLEQREHERQLVEAKARWEVERLRDEIRLAREIQQKLFPAAPLPLPGLDLAGASFPAEATGGDYFDYIPMPSGNLAVVIGDVCGHGLGPALVMAELRAYLRAFLRTRTDVGEIVGLLNQALAGDTDRFVTLLIAELDPVNRSLVYSGAGHLPGYVLDADGAVKGRLLSTGLPLAVMTDGEYTTEAAPPLRPGELALLLTDGLVEAHSPGGDPFGTDRVLDLVKQHRRRPAREIVNALYEAVRAYCGPGSQPDDMTAIVIKAE